MKVDCLTNLIKETSLMSLPLKLMIVSSSGSFLSTWKKKIKNKISLTALETDMAMVKYLFYY